MPRLPFGLTLAALALLLAPARGHSQPASPRSFTLSGRQVATWNLVGTTSVVRGTGAETVVEVTLRGRDADRLTVATREVRGRRAVVVQFPDDDLVYPTMDRGSSTLSIDYDGIWGDEAGARRRRIRVSGSGRGLEAWAEVVIRVPAAVSLSAHQGVGTFSARDVTLESLTADLMSANAQLDRVRADIAIDAGSGRVVGRELTGAVSVDVGSGSTELRLVRGDRLSIDAGSGGVTLDDVVASEVIVDVGSGPTALWGVDAQRLRLDSGSGSVRAALLRGTSDVSIEAGSGGVELSLPDRFDARIDVESGSGGIDTELPIRVTRVERNDLHGVIGEGRGQLRVETGSGRVRLMRAR
jgi:hypothetical protein